MYCINFVHAAIAAILLPRMHAKNEENEVSNKIVEWADPYKLHVIYVY